VLVREHGDALEHGVDAALQDEPLALELREKREVPLAADEHVRPRHRGRAAAREPGASVVADADDSYRTPRAHAFSPSTESARRA